MTNKLVFGKEKQVVFKNIEEKREAFDYMLKSDNVNFNIHEPNDKQGAWAPEDRIHFKKEDGIPECLKRQMTAGRGVSLFGRINCGELCEELRNEASKSNK